MALAEDALTAQVSPLLERSREEAKQVHIGVRAFLQFLEQKDILGLSLRREVKKMYDDLQQFQRFQQRNATPENLQIIEQRIEKSIVALKSKISSGDMEIVSLANKMKVFLKDEKSIRKLALELVTRRGTGAKRWVFRTSPELELTELVNKTKKALQHVAALFEVISREYYDFQEQISPLLDHFHPQNSSSADYQAVLRTILQAEMTLERVLANAELEAQRNKKAFSLFEQEKEDILRVIVGLLEQPIRYRKEIPRPL